MDHLALRRLTVVAFLPLLSLVLAACGSPAINTSGVDESLSPYPSATGPSGSSSQSGSAHAHASGHTTPGVPGSRTGRHPSSGAPSVAPQGSAPAQAGGGSGGARTCAWQAGTPSVLVTPCFDLSGTQTVTVRARGLRPGWGVIAIECVDKGTATTQNDCNLSGAGGLGTLLAGGHQPSSDGTITLTLTVSKTFTGGGGTSFTCAGSTHCIVAVTSPQHTSENATAPISFR